MILLIRASDRVILQYGTFALEPPPAGTVVEVLDPARDDELAAAFSAPNGGVTISTDHATIAALPAPAPNVQAEQQRAADAATLLNAPAVRDSQAHRDAFARLIGVKPLSIALTQDATPGDIQPL